MADNIKRMAGNGDVLVDPMMSAQPTDAFINESTDAFEEMGAFTERSYLGKMNYIATQNSCLLMNRSHVPDAMPDDNPIPTSDGKFHRKIDEPTSPLRGRIRKFVEVTGLDGETFKHVVGSVGFVASASGSVVATVGGYLASGAASKRGAGSGQHCRCC